MRIFCAACEICGSTPVATHHLPLRTLGSPPFRYGGSPEFLPGVVTSTEDGASINFDAGWHGASLPLKNVRRLNANANSSATPVAEGRGARRDIPPTLTSGAQLRSMGNILDLDVGSLGGDSFAVGEQVCFVCV